MTYLVSNKSPIVYMITCRVTNKSYIGQTRKSLAKRIADHKYSAYNRPCGQFHQAIRNYGLENFDAVILYRTHDFDELNRAEVQLIAEYNTRKNGYNTTPGGPGRRK